MSTHTKNKSENSDDRSENRCEQATIVRSKMTLLNIGFNLYLSEYFMKTAKIATQTIVLKRINPA